MSQSALFVLVRGGDRRYYFDPLGFQYLYRDLVWGPEAFEDWAMEADEIDDWDENVDGGVVIDFDARMLVWSGQRDAMTCPAVANVYQRLLDHAWPHFQVEYAARGMADLAIAADLPDAENYRFEPEARYESIADAIGLADEELDGDAIKGDEPIDVFDDYDPRAWVTLVDDQGDAYQIQLQQISMDLIDADADLVTTIKRLPQSDVPKEAQVIEGMWIDVPRREVGVWGSPDFQLHFSAIESRWQGWIVRTEDVGYMDQCRVGGKAGTLLSDAEAIGMIAPMILSNKRVKFQDMVGEIGAGIKSMALRATGCLTTMLILPVLLFALVSGDWRSAGITIAILIVAIGATFKWIELKVRRKFNPNFQRHASESNTKTTRPDAAGPIDPIQRRQKLDALLLKADLPSLTKVERQK